MVMCPAILIASLALPQAAELPRTHVDTNVPETEEFDRILGRDLDSYFRSRTGESSLSIDYELLRLGPTQSGTAYPKFYAWVQVSSKAQSARTRCCTTRRSGSKHLRGDRLSLRVGHP